MASKKKPTKKYELTDDTIQFCGKTLHRVKALTSFGFVDAGDLGGYVEGEGNLSQDGNAWVYGNARVYGDARVYGNAWVYGNAQVSGNAWVSGMGAILQIAGPQYFITVTPQNIAIGCKLKTHAEWLDVDEDEAADMDLRRELYPYYMGLVELGIKTVFKWPIKTTRAQLKKLLKAEYARQEAERAAEAARQAETDQAKAA